MTWISGADEGIAGLLMFPTIPTTDLVGIFFSEECVQEDISCQCSDTGSGLMGCRRVTVTPTSHQAEP